MTGENAPIGRRAARPGPVLCLIGAVVGAVGLLGWITGISFLTTLVPGQPQMKANTALSLLLLGAAGTLRHTKRPPARCASWRARQR